MFRETSPCHLTVMVMTENANNELLTVERIKSWQGITFPGGHLEPFESVLDAARREILEETGIRIRDVKLKGLIHWFDRDSGQRYLVWCVTAREDGGVLAHSEEGRAAWLSMAELRTRTLSPGFFEQLKVFTDPAVTEAFGSYGRDGDSELNYDTGGSKRP